jgi:UDP-N-acetyl-D-galactosamine dehydrogenase
VAVCDPWADAEEVKHEYGIELVQVDAAHPVDSLVVAVGHNEFRNLSAQELRSYVVGEKPVFSDVKSLFDREEIAEQGFTVFRL